jgi:drug/metabolite transporter (DMT)-like permease
MRNRRAPHVDEGKADLLGAGLVVVTAAQFGSVVVLGKVITDSGLSIPSFLAVRFAVAAALLALAALALRSPLSAAKGEGWRLFLLGMFGYASESALFFLALRHGTAATATLLFFTYPVFVSLLSAALGKGLPGKLLGIALGCAVAGAALVVATGHGIQIDGTGVLFAFAAAISFSLYLIGADVVLKGTSSLAGAMWVSGSAAAGLAIVAVLTGNAHAPSGAHQWTPVLATGLFTAGAFGCLFAGLRRLGAVRTSIVSASEPLAAATLAAIFLHQSIRPGVIAGGVLILAGAVIASMARRPPREEAPVP